MHRIFILFALLAWLAPAATDATASEKRLPRVMSLNLCADAYLMNFADKDQIVALTHLSRDAALSAHVDAAQAFPVSDGQIEAIIELKPELVIVSSWSDPMRNALIERLGIELVMLDAAKNFAAARQEIVKLGKAIGRESEAQHYLSTLDAAMAALEPVGETPTLLPLQRRNLTVGRGHILDEIITLAGGTNLGARMAEAMSQISLETALASKADFVLLNEGGETADSRGMEFITHPALRAAYPPHRQIRIPHNLLVCSGATTPRAVALLIERLTQAQRFSASQQ